MINFSLLTRIKNFQMYSEKSHFFFPSFYNYYFHIYKYKNKYKRDKYLVYNLLFQKKNFSNEKEDLTLAEKRIKELTSFLKK